MSTCRTSISAPILRSSANRCSAMSPHRSPISWSYLEISPSGRTPNQFEKARAFLDRLPGPVLTVVGNHDLPLFNLPRRLLSQTRRYEHYINPDLDPVVAVPGLVAVGLDTMPAWRWKAGHVSPRQAGIVRDAFGNAPADAWRILVTHHPVLPKKLSGLVGRQLLVNACAETGVAVLLSGHTHVASVSIAPLGEPARHSALAVVSGTTISRRTRGSPNTYGVLHLAGPREVGASLTLELRQADGMDWSVGLNPRFEYTPNGVIALGAVGFDPA